MDQWKGGQNPVACTARSKTSMVQTSFKNCTGWFDFLSYSLTNGFGGMPKKCCSVSYGFSGNRNKPTDQTK